MNKYDYTGNKIENFFIAYLQKCIRWKRQNYLKKKGSISDAEKPFEENISIDYDATIDELLEMCHREELLLRERNGIYPAWNELSDQRLINTLIMLDENERRILYQHVFEERTFGEIGYLIGLSNKRVKGIYYYSIRKIRKWMGGNNDGI